MTEATTTETVQGTIAEEYDGAKWGSEARARVAAKRRARTLEAEGYAVARRTATYGSVQAYQLVAVPSEEVRPVNP